MKWMGPMSIDQNRFELERERAPGMKNRAFTACPGRPKNTMSTHSHSWGQVKNKRLRRTVKLNQNSWLPGTVCAESHPVNPTR